jgi:hypothetical protein
MFFEVHDSTICLLDFETILTCGIFYFLFYLYLNLIYVKKKANYILLIEVYRAYRMHNESTYI